MTFKEKAEQVRPDAPIMRGPGLYNCPYMYGLERERICINATERNCEDCWNRQIPGTEDNPHILDSGERRQFETGAVRDIQKGKGRCDLMPLEVVAHFFADDTQETHPVLSKIAAFMVSNDTEELYFALGEYAKQRYDSSESAMFLEVAKHFEEGAKKYGENNWQKGLPAHCYIDSAVRHYLKWLRGDKDEPHERAFVWNLLCCIWECDFSPRAKMEGMPVGEEGRKPSVAYICDRTQCDGGCPNPDCHHTEDVRHAKNFESAPGAKGTVYIEKVPELTNAIAKNPQTTLEDCPIGLFRLDENLYLKTNARYEHNSICVIPVDNGVGVAIENTRMVTPTRIRSYAVSEQKVAVCGIKSGFVELNDEIWLLCGYNRNTYMRDAYSINSGKSITLISADMVQRVEVYEYE